MVISLIDSKIEAGMERKMKLGKRIDKKHEPSYLTVHTLLLQHVLLLPSLKTLRTNVPFHVQQDL